MKFENFDDLVLEVSADRDARTAGVENARRRRIGVLLDQERTRLGMSVRDLARAIGTSVSQTQRLLHQQQGGSLTLRTIVRAADALNMEVFLTALPQCSAAEIIASGSVRKWQSVNPTKWQPTQVGGQCVNRTSERPTDEWRSTARVRPTAGLATAY